MRRRKGERTEALLLERTCEESEYEPAVRFSLVRQQHQMPHLSKRPSEAGAQQLRTVETLNGQPPPDEHVLLLLPIAAAGVISGYGKQMIQSETDYN